MGTNSKWACRTCKVWKHCGYGSYSSVERRVAAAVPPGHEGHETFSWTGDSEWGREGGVLYDMGSYGKRGDPIIDQSYTRLDDEETA